VFDNAALHLPAIANEAAIKFRPCDVAEVSRARTYLADMKPGGRYMAVDPSHPAVCRASFKALLDGGHLHGDCLTSRVVPWPRNHADTSSRRTRIFFGGSDRCRRPVVSRAEGFAGAGGGDLQGSRTQRRAHARATPASSSGRGWSSPRAGRRPPHGGQEIIPLSKTGGAWLRRGA